MWGGVVLFSWPESKCDETIGKLRIFIYILIPLIGSLFVNSQQNNVQIEYLWPIILTLPGIICQYRVAHQERRSYLLALCDLIFIGLNVMLYRNWSLFSLHLLPMSTVRHYNKVWTMGLIGIVGILVECLFLWETEEYLSHLMLHCTFAILFIIILKNATSIELYEERERLKATQLLHELRMAHDSLKENNRNLFYLAQTDALTELYNFRFFEKTITNYFENAKRQGYALSLLMIDVDHFKDFNDTFGHLFGDKVLKTIACILKKSVRKEDLVCRYGGEEFSIILPKTGLAQAKDLAERICHAIRNFEYREIGLKRITVSIGISAYPEEAQSVRELAEFADQALYEAKRQGRDCVVVRRIINPRISL